MCFLLKSPEVRMTFKYFWKVPVSTYMCHMIGCSSIFYSPDSQVYIRPVHFCSSVQERVTSKLCTMMFTINSLSFGCPVSASRFRDRRKIIAGEV